MGFNEMTHAFLAARYYIRFTEQFGDRGREAFIHGIQYYGSQRGRRMAQRAIRDGKPLTYENYCRYGEWVNTEKIKAMGAANRVEIGGYDPDYIMNIYSCPWFAQFQKMGAGEAGKAYCSVLDASISRGFNPDIRYEVPQTLHTHDHCVQIVRNAGLTPEMKIEKYMPGVRSFEYHCAHTFWSLREVSEGIFGDEGVKASDAVLEDFAKEYGREMADTIAGYKDTNFNMA